MYWFLNYTPDTILCALPTPFHINLLTALWERWYYLCFHWHLEMLSNFPRSKTSAERGFKFNHFGLKTHVLTPYYTCLVLMVQLWLYYLWGCSKWQRLYYKGSQSPESCTQPENWSCVLVFLVLLCVYVIFIFMIFLQWGFLKNNYFVVEVNV